jgi:hypothetical protein
VARAAPDGYTLLVHNLQIAANVSLYENLPFDTVKTFVPVMLINRNPLVLVGRKTLEPNTLRDLVILMKQQTLKVAIAGYGTTGHLTTSLFAQEAGVSLDQIPYRGAAPAVTDLLGGQVDLFFATPQSVVQQVATGALKAYGVTAKEKLPEFSARARTETRCDVLASHVRPRGNPGADYRHAQQGVAKRGIRSSPCQYLGGGGRVGLPAGSAFFCGGTRDVEQRNRALGAGHPRQQYPHSTMKMAARPQPAACASQRLGRPIAILRSVDRKLRRKYAPHAACRPRSIRRTLDGQSAGSRPGLAGVNVWPFQR